MKEKIIQELTALVHTITNQTMENADFSVLKKKVLSLYENLTIAEYLQKATLQTPNKEKNQAKESMDTPIILTQNTTVKQATEISLEDLLAQVPSDPIFEEKSFSKDTPIKTLNDVINTQIFQIGLNDRIAFINYLFEGSEADFTEAVDALKKQPSADVALRFIQEKIKPVFNNWEGKEEYEERFVNIILRKFN